MANSAEPLPLRCLRRWATCVARHPRWLLYPQLLLAAMAAFWTATHLTFSTDRNALVGSDKKYQQVFLEFKQNFHAETEIVVVVESADPRRSQAYVDRLGSLLEARDDLFAGVFYRIGPEQLGKKALQFLDEAELTELNAFLDRRAAYFRELGQTTNPVSLVDHINAGFRSGSGKTKTEQQQWVASLPRLSAVFEMANRHVSADAIAPATDMTSLLGDRGEEEGEGFVTLADGRYYLISLRSAASVPPAETIAPLRRLVREAQGAVPGVNAGITGEPVLEYEEMVQARRDMSISSMLALLLVAFIFIVAFRETKRPLKATFCVLLGLAYTLGYTTLAVGHLNILTIIFAPILIGLAIDLGIHLITRYEEGLRKGGSREAALEKAMVETGSGILTGALTTAGGFFALALTDFKGVQEMGIIAGGGTLICLVPMMSFLPAWLFVEGNTDLVAHHYPHRRTVLWRRIEELWLIRPRTALGIGGVLSLLAVTQLNRVSFDYNLLNLQTKNAPPVKLEKELVDNATKSVVYGAVIADSVDEALALKQRLLQLPTVAAVDSAASWLTPIRSQEKMALMREIRERAADIPLPRPDNGEVALEKLQQNLWILEGYVSIARKDVTKTPEAAPLARKLARLKRSVAQFRSLVHQGDPARVADRLGRFQQRLINEWWSPLALLARQEVTAPIEPGDLPSALRERFIGKGGRLLLQVYPKKNIWQRVYQEAFIEDIRKVAPRVTGTPVQIYEYTTLLRDSYIAAAWYALAAILMIVSLHFRLVLSAPLVLLPVFIGSLWLAGIMGALRIPLNPANILALPLVIGIGVACGIHVLNRFVEEKDPTILTTSTGKAVIVSALTTMAGFGSLILAQHRGIASFGLIMSIGVMTTSAVALTFLPALLVLLHRAGWGPQPGPRAKDESL